MRHANAMDDSLLDDYHLPADRLDEALDTSGDPRVGYESVFTTLRGLGPSALRERAELGELLQRSRGESFTVSSAQNGGGDRPLPLDLVPRIIGAAEWQHVEAGVRQRVRALEAFLADIYTTREILLDKVIPSWVVLSSPSYRREAWNLPAPAGARIQVAGPDLVRDSAGVWMVLEDNVRVPSGASYVLEHREILTRVLPELFQSASIQPVEHYAKLLHTALDEVAPARAGSRPRVVLLAPGVHNAARFEHAFLARHMGIELVEGSDLVADSDGVHMRTTQGLQRVDVIHRRIDELFLDPVVFRPDSVLGVPGLVHAARAGLVTIANAIGTGIADDKAVTSYVPEMIRYYLGEEPLLGNVPTLLCGEPEQAAEALSNAEQLVFKPINGSGGMDVLLGPYASPQELEVLSQRVRANPRGWIAQRFLHLSQHPTFTGKHFQPHCIDLRPFVVHGQTIEVLPGGLTRVALGGEGGLVNSSRGGGSKDTWVLRSALASHGETPEMPWLRSCQTQQVHAPHDLQANERQAQQGCGPC